MTTSSLLLLGLGTCVASVVSWDHYLVIALFIPFALVTEVPWKSWRGLLVIASTVLLFIPWWRFRYGRLNHSWTHLLHVIATLAPLSACLLFALAVLLEGRGRRACETSSKKPAEQPSLAEKSQ